MKFYLSSYQIGDAEDHLHAMLSTNPNVFYIANALDAWGAGSEELRTHCDEDKRQLEELGLTVQSLDLRTYFQKQEELERVLADAGGVWISGGNVFVLRQAMKLSGLDVLLQKALPTPFVYGGYSAACCVLSKRLDAYQIVDASSVHPYSQLQETLWDGLGFLEYAFLPHADSDHPESADISREITYCKENNIPFKALRDGEVLLGEGITIPLSLEIPVIS